MSIDLQPFCSTDDFRPYLNTPFRFNGYVYATDGRMMVRVDDNEAYPSSDKVNPEEVIAPALAASFIKAAPVDLPPKSPDAPKMCQECDGRGTEHDCPDCQCDCDTCHGSGKIVSWPLISATLADQLFDLDYLRLLYSLPELEIAPNAAVSGGISTLPLFFRFAGGVGVVMPLSREYPTHIDRRTYSVPSQNQP